MLLRLAMLGGLGYAAYNYYTKNREQVDGALRKLGGSAGEGASGGGGSEQSNEGAEVAGGPLSSNAQVVHAGEGPLAGASS